MGARQWLLRWLLPWLCFASLVDGGSSEDESIVDWMKSLFHGQFMQEFPEPSRARAAFDWQLLGSSARLSSHMANGLDQSIAVFTQVDSIARSLVAMPWGDRERTPLLRKAQALTTALPGEGIRRETDYQVSMLRRVVRAESPQESILKDELLRIKLFLQLMAQNSSQAVVEAAVRRPQELAVLGPDILRGRVKWLENLVDRRSDITSSLIEYSVRFSLAATPGARAKIVQSAKALVAQRGRGNSTLKEYNADGTREDGSADAKLEDFFRDEDLVTVLERAFLYGDDWVYKHARRLSNLLHRSRKKNSSMSSMPSLTSGRGGGSGRKEDRAALKLRAHSLVLNSLDRCRSTSSKTDSYWVYEWCNMHRVVQWSQEALSKSPDDVVDSTNVLGIHAPGEAAVAFNVLPRDRDAALLRARGEEGAACATTAASTAASPCAGGATDGKGNATKAATMGTVSDRLPFPSTEEFGLFLNGSSRGCEARGRATLVRHRCCHQRGRAPEGLQAVHGVSIHRLGEPQPCRYRLDVCIPYACPSHPLHHWWTAQVRSSRRLGTQAQSPEQDALAASSSNAFAYVQRDPTAVDTEHLDDSFDFYEMSGWKAAGGKATLRERVRQLFTRSYDHYMAHAFPRAELRPLSCEGGDFSLVNVSMVTLIDSLDALAIMGNATEFARAIKLVEAGMTFDVDDTVSVFEATIRLLGGLLSAHLIAAHPTHYGLLPGCGRGNGDQGTGVAERCFPYNGGLLKLAEDLGSRLLPAFDTPTGIPVGSINLHTGALDSETTASLAGAGSLILEFAMLSALTGNQAFANASMTAMVALHDRRSPRTGLVGKHISTDTGEWVETNSGIGSTGDSFFEYLLKAGVLYDSAASLDMWHRQKTAIDAFARFGPWYVDVDLDNGMPVRTIFDSLQGFWPGLMVLDGEVEEAARTLNAFVGVWRQFGAVPEEFDWLRWKLPRCESGGCKFPLRPEVLESVMHVFQATKHESWTELGALMLGDLERLTWATCGHASLEDVSKASREDSMPSFFLSETLKYLYLLFDDTNALHGETFVFTTEGHPLPVGLARLEEKREGGRTSFTARSTATPRREAGPTSSAEAPQGRCYGWQRSKLGDHGVGLASTTAYRHDAVLESY